MVLSLILSVIFLKLFKSATIKISEKIGLPLVIRPSYVLGGRAMEIVHEKNLLWFWTIHLGVIPGKPVIMPEQFWAVWRLTNDVTISKCWMLKSH